MRADCCGGRAWWRCGSRPRGRTRDIPGSRGPFRCSFLGGCVGWVMDSEVIEVLRGRGHELELGGEASTRGGELLLELPDALVGDELALVDVEVLLGVGHAIARPALRGLG